MNSHENRERRDIRKLKPIIRNLVGPVKSTGPRHVWLRSSTTQAVCSIMRRGVGKSIGIVGQNQVGGKGGVILIRELVIRYLPYRRPPRSCSRSCCWRALP